MPGINAGRVAIVTGAGRGIGREHALELARQGAKVVVNDLGAEVDGAGRSGGPAGDVVEAIRLSGGEAVANGEDVSDWEGAGRLVTAAIDTFGGLDVLVNNAGILRDRMLVNMDIDEWDAVIKVHLRGTFAPTRWATGYWRDRCKSGEGNDARIINTTSAAGALRRHRERNQPRCPYPHDGKGEPGGIPAGAVRRVRRRGSREHRSTGGVARQSPGGARHRAGVHRSGWTAPGARGLARGSRGRQGRALGSGGPR
jgi:NAD(P)-dependent dehydrogenase (short-subunit alcohol dehydrogenase family)